ncbi:DUF6328 family protein [Longispora sp. NPDC051575]|uniref:DUF6328 family protein n=1 Tax=Longispora sp. NPDC051575 TaxID=3154943 RepID=UPI003417A44B
MTNPADHEAETGESPKARVDRETIELLNGLRVILPGVQVLFAFLLAVPFATGFAQADAFQRDVLLVTAVAAAVSTILLIAPAAQHRVLFRAGAKEELLHRANRFAVAGTLTLGVAMIGALLLILDFVFARGIAIGVCVAVAALLVWSWQIQPAIIRRRSSRT